MTEPERLVAGLRCTEVLALLSEYYDDELTAEQVHQIEAHLAGCGWCERFTENFTAVLQEFRRQLADPEPLDAVMHARLLARISGFSNPPAGG